MIVSLLIISLLCFVCNAEEPAAPAEQQPPVKLTVVQKTSQKILGGNANSFNQNQGQSFIVNKNKFQAGSDDDGAEETSTPRESY